MKLIYLIGGVVLGIYTEQTYHMPSIRMVVDVLVILYFIVLSISPEQAQIQIKNQNQNQEQEE
jgi:hypothetical protein